MELALKLRELAESHLVDSSHFVVDVLISKYKPTKIVVQLDGDRGISIDSCAEVSRKLSEDLETLNLIEGAYNLEVGTPGLDVPLKLKRQYYANIERSIKMQLKTKNYMEGKLLAVTEEQITIETPSKERKKELIKMEILFTDIEKTIVTVSFN
ncbi:MAG: ribosome maturation factor RimP [Cytophagales bacterium]|nr:ribosome maturation factor RimP [Cytophagales bacterium]MCA6366801.1 ribosome maturation factor RimP [Cytophagales bacterium]MCA6370857.1 ribosome maturation factor RimP [Cytophagales bacterium]MCA6375274.1 ribosome maturation factor RimP [Cytophagales bacterium]MCA6381975.1 ribosome maturation factor RimP [Cytophagales bacterium]